MGKNTKIILEFYAGPCDGESGESESFDDVLILEWGNEEHAYRWIGGQGGHHSQAIARYKWAGKVADVK